MDKQVLKAEERDLNKVKPKVLRESGKTPAVVYGKKCENKHLSVDTIEFEKLFREVGSSSIVTLLVGDNKKNVLIHDVSHHPVTDAPEHIDFYEVSMTEKITTNVPLIFVGESAAVVDQNGSLITNTTEIEIECLPADLPHEIEVDISVLSDFESTIHVSDVKIPSGVEVKTELEALVATVEPPRSEEELAELEEPVAEAELPESEQGGEDDEAPEGEAPEGESKEADNKE